MKENCEMKKQMIVIIANIACISLFRCNYPESDESRIITNTGNTNDVQISLDTSVLYTIYTDYISTEKITPMHKLPNIYTVIFSSQSGSNFMIVNGNTEIPTFVENSGFKVPDPIGVLFSGDSPVLIFDENIPIGKQFYSMLDLNTDTIADIVNLYDSQMAKGFLSNIIYPHWSYTFETGSQKVVLVEKSKIKFIKTNNSQRTWILTNPELFNVDLDSSYSYK